MRSAHPTQVGLAELLAVALGKSSESRTQLLRALFAKLDVDGDELISLGGPLHWSCPLYWTCVQGA